MKKDPSTNYEWMIGPNKLSTENTFIRKGEVGGWVDYFSDEQSKLFDAMFDEKMSGINLEFQFQL